MTGLGVLYASEAAKEPDWGRVPDRDKTGRLREVYWAYRAYHHGETVSGRKPALRLRMRWQTDRAAIGRRNDEAGDVFLFLVNLAPRVEDRFEWMEVTEVFTTVEPKQIEGAMRAWNDIGGKHRVDFDAFRKGLKLGRPSRLEQRIAADRVIEQIGKKLAKSSHDELLEKYGYGTLVVGMPLWFAVHPDDLSRAENAIDDFMTRTTLGLEELKRTVLRRRDCPFGKVVVVWEPTLEALREWLGSRSSEHRSSANSSPGDPMGARSLEQFYKTLTEIPESAAPSWVKFPLDTTVNKKAPGRGPHPLPFRDIAAILRESARPTGHWTSLKAKVVLTISQLLCFVRTHGVEGLKRRIARKFPVAHALKRNAVRRKQRQFYRESRRRNWVFCGGGASRLQIPGGLDRES